MTPTSSSVQARPEILRADPQMRRRAVVVVLAIGMLGAAAIQWLLPWANETVEQAVRDGMPRSTVCKTTLVVLSAFAAGVAAFGFYIVRLGRRIVAAGCFPPPGQKVIRDTRVLRGRAAELLGRTQTFLGASLIALAGALLALTGYGLCKLMN